jgi:hypothetical protein
MDHLRMIAACAVSISCAGSAVAQEQQSYAYDVHGRLVSVHRDGPTASLVTGYGLDGADNRMSRTSVATMTAVWEAESLNHYTGFAEADGWAANAQQPQSLLIAGPYTTAVPVGSRVAVWRMMIDGSLSSDLSPVLKLDVFDLSTMEVLVEVYLPRASWRADWTYQWFEVPFQMDAARAGHIMEFRVHYIPSAHVRVDKVGYR